MTEYDEFWEPWVGTTASPVEHVKPRARVNNRDGRRWITFPDKVNGKRSSWKCRTAHPPAPALATATTTAVTASAGPPRAAFSSSSASPASCGAAAAHVTATRTAPAACFDNGARSSPGGARAPFFLPGVSGARWHALVATWRWPIEIHSHSPFLPSAGVAA